jgi:plastocyanin
MNNKTLLLIAAGVAVIVVMVFVFMARQTAVPEPGIEEEVVENIPEGLGEETEGEFTTQIVRVAYTDAGFSPSTVTVSVGTTVVWQNNSPNCMWVASNPHPTHTDLPELDSGACAQTYQFTFNKTGSWGYHNHFAASQTGIVVVQ